LKKVHLPNVLGILFGGVSLAVLIGFLSQRLAQRRDLRKHPAPGRLVDVGGFRMHIHAGGKSSGSGKNSAGGKGSPTVVLDSGSGGTSLDWTNIQAELAKSTRVCSYDRAGHGWSDAGRHAHTLANIAQDLDALLRISQEQGPFVLVGHSLGGLYANYFARRYPEQVAGMVLVDAVPPEIYDELPVKFHLETRRMLQRRYLSALFGLMRLGVLREDSESETELGRMRSILSLRPGFWREALKQNRNLGPGVNRVVESAGPFPDIPLVVITPAKAPWLESIRPDLPEKWLAGQQRLTGLTPQGRLVVVEKASHDLLTDAPQVIVQAVKEISSRPG
jgi:pimeloyl-ACP methyl ester carboxylesterase